MDGEKTAGQAKEERAKKWHGNFGLSVKYTIIATPDPRRHNLFTQTF